MKILFTSVGRRVELIQAFHHAAEKLHVDLKIYGADISMTAPALAYCNKKIHVCKITDKSYIPQLLSICAEEHIDALIPTIDTDLLILSQNKIAFSTVRTKIIVSDEDTVAICRDKLLTSDFFVRCGLKTPIPVDNIMLYDSGFPAFIKPKGGSSSINAYRVNSQSELMDRVANIEDYIIQPFISGTEYTVDIFCDFNGNPVFITPRERMAVRSGEVLKAGICNDEIIINECRKFTSILRPCGQITVQLIRQASTGDNYYIEINPRFGGGAPLTIKSGADSAEAIIRLLNGDKLGYSGFCAVDGAVYSRFDQSICVSFGSKPKIKAVIFDLDDTLYPELDYIRSGFTAIEKKFGIPADLLYAAFKDRKPAIDTVLKQLHKESLKDECIRSYRYNKPLLEPYEGVRELIHMLKDNGIFVGIITDGRSEGQRAKLAALNLDIDNVIITDELGSIIFRKPCDIAFHMMQKLANVDFAEMVYIGDNAEKDFLAPNQLGMQCIHTDFPGRIYSGTCDNICTVNTVAELSELLTGKIIHD